MRPAAHTHGMERTFTSTETMKLTGVSYRQLDYWRTSGLVVPSAHRPTGTGDPCAYSFDDLVALRVVKAMLDSGVSLQKARHVLAYMRERGGADVVLMDGGMAFPVFDETDVAHLLQHATAATFVRVSAAREELRQLVAA